MSPSKQIEAFAQSIYLTIKNRYFDEIEGEDGQVYISQIIDWTNMFVDELENEVSTDGQLVDWWFVRESAATLGTASAGSSTTALPIAVDRLITDEGRYVQVLQDGTPVSNWAVSHPKDILNYSGRTTEDRCALVGTNIVFSRPFRDTEASGTIVGDVITKLPRLAPTNAKLLTTVKPKQLLILGVAKNATLPDIVQGGLSPSYVQKFNDLLTSAIARSAASSVSARAERDSFGHVRGNY